MKKKTDEKSFKQIFKESLAFWGIVVLVTFLVIVSFLGGTMVSYHVDRNHMTGYTLYNCIWNNARINGFSQHPRKIQLIEDECICFREHNYTDIRLSDC